MGERLKNLENQKVGERLKNLEENSIKEFGKIGD